MTAGAGETAGRWPVLLRCCVRAHVCLGQRTNCESVLFFYHVGSGIELRSPGEGEVLLPT